VSDGVSDMEEIVCVCCIQDAGYIDLVVPRWICATGAPRHSKEIPYTLYAAIFRPCRREREGGEGKRERERRFFSVHATLRRAFKCDKCFLLSNFLLPY